MPLRTTVGQVLINEALPESMRDYTRRMDGAGMKALLQQVAEQQPDKYREVSKALLDVGRDVSYQTGGYSFGLKDLRTSPKWTEARKHLQVAIAATMAGEGTDEEKQNKIVEMVQKANDKMTSTILEDASAQKNPLALQVLSGTRGKPANLRSLLGADGLYEDHRNRTIPVPILNSYSRGLTPAEYFAGAFGARKGVSDTKFCLMLDTLIRMADWSVKPIQQVQPGDWVLGADRTGATFPVQVVRRYDNGLRVCRRYVFRQRAGAGLSVGATADHKILAKLKLGKPGSTYGHRSVYVPTPLPLGTARKDFRATAAGQFLGAEGISEPRAALLGVLLGDGCTSPTSSSITFSCADPLLAEAVGGFTERIGLQVFHNYRYNYLITSGAIDGVPKKGPKDEAYAQFKQWLSELGLIGCLAHEKKLPANVHGWDNKSVFELIGGLWATDGTVSPDKTGRAPHLKFFSTSLEMIQGLRDLLQYRLGIYIPTVTSYATEGRQFAKHVLHVISINGRAQVTTFWRNIPLPGRKQAILDGAMASLPEAKQENDVGFSYVRAEDLGLQETFDLEVDHPDHLYVLANGLVSSNSTQNAGFLSKQMSQVAHRIVVSDLDEEDPEYAELHAKRGLPVDTNDSDNEGALLSYPVGGYPRNTLLTSRVLKDLSAKGHDRIVVRSPVAGGAYDGGLFARDLGLRHKGTLPARGSAIGLTSSQALSEPISQGQLSSKHSGGVAGTSKSVSGFKYINQMVQIPKAFPGGATHSTLDGRVERIEDAPQGGQFVYVGDQQHYVPPGHELKVKHGDTVEGGDVLTDGIPNPAEVVAHKGVGEGRAYFVRAFKSAMKESGMSGHRRNVEVLARGLINHVEMLEENDDNLPGDVVPYDALERDWVPREGTRKAALKAATGKYLERPVLHYTVGTKIRPSVIKELDSFGIKDLDVHDDPPPFKPVMVRAMDNLQHDPDWMTRMLGSNLKKNLLGGVHAGDVADTEGTSYVAGLALDPLTFGRKGMLKSPDPVGVMPDAPKPLGGVL